MNVKWQPHPRLFTFINARASATLCDRLTLIILALLIIAVIIIVVKYIYTKTAMLGKKFTALNSQGEKDAKSKVVANILVTTIQVNLCVLQGIGT